ncbi:MAG: S8 family peptidase, partial [Pyrinomonadaceae bacterium]
MFLSLSSRKSVLRIRFRLLVLTLAALLLTSAWPSIPQARLQSSELQNARPKTYRPEFVPGEILIRFRPETVSAKSQTRTEMTVRAEGREINIEVESLGGVDVFGGLRVAHVAPEETSQAIAALNARPDVLYAEPNYIRHASKTPNDTRYPQIWNLKNTGQPDGGGHPGQVGVDIHAEPAWDQTTGSKSIVVGVIDEGIDINHPDLKDNIWTNTAEVPDNGVDDDGNGYVDDVNGWDFAHNDKTVFDYTGATYPPPPNYSGDVEDHGTHVAGTIGATGNNATGVVGVNWQVSLMSLKFLTGADGAGSTADLLRAYGYAKMMRELWQSSGGTKGANIRVLNNSYGGGGFSQAEFDAIRALGDAGILFVVAAGNEGTNNDMFPTYPANYISTNIISVAASTSSGLKASFSNFGPGTVNMTAPGDNILSTTPKGTYDFFSGTSMAAPHVSGGAALVCAAYPNISMSKLRSTLIYSGYVAQWQGIYIYNISSGRTLDVNSALQAVVSADTVAPAAVGQLHANYPTFPTFSLTWQSPGDDGNTGKVAAYQVRYSDTDLSDP